MQIVHNVFCADIGTTALKTALIDWEGKVLFSERISFSEGEHNFKKEPEVSSKPSHNGSSDSANLFIAKKWFSAFRESFFRLSKASGEYPDSICISGNGPTLVLENGRTLLWNKKADVVGADEKSKKSPSLFIPRLKLLKSLYPEEYKASRRVFSGPEYLVYLLSGAEGTVLPEERFLPAYWDEKTLKEEGFSSEEIEKLPPFVSLGKVSGFLREDFLEGKLVEDGLSSNDKKGSTSQKEGGLSFRKENNFTSQKEGGLSSRKENNSTSQKTGALPPKKIPVVFGGPDFVMAMIGTGSIKIGKLCDRSGSSEGINFCTERPVFSPKVRTLPSVIPGLWNISVIIEESGILLDSFKTEIEKLSGKDFTYEEIIEYCYEDKNSEGYRILKSIDQKVKEALSTIKTLAKENSLPFEDFMTVTGGLAKNSKYLRNKVLDIQEAVTVLENPDSELTGDAVLALYSLGVYKSLAVACEKMIRVKKHYSLGEKSSSEMKIYRIPEKLSAIIFDIDSTLYTSEAYAIEQVDVQIRCIAKKMGITPREARNLISEYRRCWRVENGGKKISLGNTLLHFGVSIEESVRMRENLLEPRKFLGRDEKLIKTLENLSSRFKMICVTNNPVLPARKTLDALGVSPFFPVIIGLDVSGKSKPAREPFLLASEKLQVPLSECLSVGDRYDMDISLPLEMGAGGILVSGVEDVYRLVDVL